MRVLVCGGRDYQDINRVSHVLTVYMEEKGIDCIIQGGATGADTLAKDFAHRHAIDCQEYKADWETYGKSAGYRRNREMLELGKPDLIIAFPGGKGTANMVKLGRDAGIRILEVN
jgi:hypothetical protein